MRYKRTAVAVLTLVILIALFPSSPTEAQPITGSSAVLVPAVRPGDAKEPLRRTNPATIRRARYVVANVDAVTLAAAGDRTVELPLFDDTKVTTTADGVEGDAANLSWRGPVSRQGKKVGTVTMSAIGRYLYAVVIADGRLYRIEPVGAGIHVVYELDTDSLPEDGDSPEAHGETFYDQPSGDGGGSGGVSAASSGSDPGSPTIDLLVVYTTAARQSVADIRSSIQAAVNTSNDIYANSGITQRVRLVDAREVSYVSGGNPGNDLRFLTDTSDGFMDAVHGWRDSLGTDLVHLWGTGYNRPGGACGVGWIQASVGATFESSGFSLMDITCQANFVMAHELGHNMSARHDWAVDATNNSPYTYNHGFTHVSDTQRWRTVMAYDNACAPNCVRIPHFSNPAVTHLNTATGRPEGQPNAADNSKTLNNTALVTNAFRSISMGDGTRADINGDGKDDVLSFQQGGTGQVWAAVSNGSSLNTPTLWNPWGAFSYTGHVPAVGDVNGDGRDDILNFQQGDTGQVWAALSNGSTFDTPGLWNPWGAFSYTGSLPAVGDVNGDGRADMLSFQQHNGQVWVALSNGSTFNPPTLWNPWGAFSNEGHVPRVGDVNGDGRADMVNFQRDGGGSVWVALSNGSSFNTPGQWTISFAFAKETPRLGDVNGDGKADAVVFTQGNSGQVKVGLSIGSGFTAGAVWNPWGPFSYIATVPFTADLNGDGKADILNFQQGNNGQIWAATANLLGTQFNLPTHWNPWGAFSYGGSVPI